jgi:hypothetical protein
MPRRTLILLILLLCGPFVRAGVATADTESAPTEDMVLIRVADRAAVARFMQTGMAAYAHFHAADGAYLLAAADDDGRTALAAADLSAQRLPARLDGGPLYLAYPAPGRAALAWEQFGQLLYADARVALLATSAEQAEALASAGADIVRISLAPIVLQTDPSAVATFPPVTAPDPVVEGMLSAVQLETIRQYTGDLTGEWPAMIRGTPYTIATRNSKSGIPVRQATYYVGDHLTARGLAVEYQEWNFDRPPNVIGQLTGQTRPGDIYMITAHLDNMPDGLLAPGADDNASGSVAVLVAADTLSHYRWDCTLRFALWTGEEQGLLGSNAYAERAAARGEKILGVLNLDMIAWNTPGSPPDIDLHATALRPATVELANQFASVVGAYGMDLLPEVRTDGTGASDHASFWDSGYTAILGIEDFYPNYHDFSPYYHQTSDLLATLDMTYFTEYVKAAVASLAHMSGCLDKTPAAPTTSIELDSDQVTLTWQHVLPNTAYAIHRGTNPWFTPEPATLRETVNWPFPEALIHEDSASGTGDAAINHFYAVLGLNAAGNSAVSNRTGEFDFELVTP